MSPEQEAELRARMAAARNDVDGDGLEVSVEPTDQERIDASYGGMFKGWNPDMGGHPLGPQIVSGATHGVEQPREAFITPEDKQAAANAVRMWQHRLNPVLGTVHTVADAVARHYEGQKGKEIDQQVQSEALNEKEATLRKAMEKAKQIAAVKAQQEKITKDRDEAIESGRHGYRVERALYPSDLHRK